MSITSNLLTAANYALLAYSGITNTGATLIGGGNAGSFPTTSITGLTGANFIPPAGIDNTHAQQAEIDALAAYNSYKPLGTLGRSFTSLGGSSVNLSVSGNGVNNSTYVSGNYSAGSSMDIPTTITLDAQGNPNAEFVFFATSTLTLESGASVLLVNGALARNVLWLVGSSFTSIFAGTSVMQGDIIAQNSISLGGGVLNGRALAGVGNSSGAVTIASAESILVPAATTTVPLPAAPAGSPTNSGGSYKCLISQNLGSSVLTAWPQITTEGTIQQFLDLVQIVDEGGNVVLNVNFAGLVNYPAVLPTNGTRIGQFYTRTSGFPTTTLPILMADTFTNPSLLDIIQVINLGGNISYFWDYLGVAHGS